MSLCAIYYNDLFLNTNGEITDLNKVLPFKKINFGTNYQVGISLFCLKCYGNKFLAYDKNSLYLEDTMNENTIMYQYMPNRNNIGTILGFHKYIFFFMRNKFKI